MGSTATPGPSPGVCIRSTIRGSSAPISPAATVRRRSGRVIRRASATASIRARPRPTSAPKTSTSARYSWLFWVSAATAAMSATSADSAFVIGLIREFAAATQVTDPPMSGS